jgi:clan AA aspartic protease (TIGR02281 family)
MYPGLCKRVMTSTANGNREACEVTIKQMQVKKCIAKNVEALVYIDDEKDSDDPLLGMSFLNKFKIVLDRGVMKIYC